MTTSDESKNISVNHHPPTYRTNQTKQQHRRLIPSPSYYSMGSVLLALRVLLSAAFIVKEMQHGSPCTGPKAVSPGSSTHQKGVSSLPIIMSSPSDLPTMSTNNSATSTCRIRNPSLTTAVKDGHDENANGFSGSTLQHQNQRDERLANLPISHQSTVLARRIQSQCRTPAEALQIIEEHIPVSGGTNNNNNNNNSNSLEWEDAWFAVLQVCAKTKEYAQAVDIVQTRTVPSSSDRCRSLAIAICGRCQQLSLGLSLLPLRQIEGDTPTMNGSTKQSHATTITMTTPAPYNAAIAACGTNRDWQAALTVVYKTMPRSFVTCLTCNAVLTALVKSQRGTEAVAFLRDGFSHFGVKRDRASYHHALSALIGQGSVEEATELVLKEMREESKTNPDVIPSQETYDRLMAPLVALRNALSSKNDSEIAVSTDEDQQRQQRYDRCTQLLEQLQQAAQEVPADLKAEAKKKKKRKQPDTLQFSTLPDKKRSKTSADSATAPNEFGGVPLTRNIWDFCKWELPKRGKGKTSFWELGTIRSDEKDAINGDDDENSDIIVGLHPNRNPSKNGIQLWFFRENKTRSEGSSDSDGQYQKLGYLLMINTPHYNPNDEKHGITGEEGAIISESKKMESTKVTMAGSSKFLGLRVMDDNRRKGLAKIMAAVWLQCCLDANIKPSTGKMNKPLLCLVLQHSFQFTLKHQTGGVRAKLLPPQNKDDNDKGVVRLTTESLGVKNLLGAISPRDVQKQHIKFVPPTLVQQGELGRGIDVGGILVAPESRDVLQDCITQVLEDKWKLAACVDTVSSLRVLPNENDKVDKTDAPLTMSRLFLGV